MKNTTIIVSSLLGGAILGAAITLCLSPKSAHEMRSNAHERILKKIKHLHSMIESAACRCGEDGGSCSMEEHKKMEQSAAPIE